MPLEATVPQSASSDIKGKVLVIDDEADIRESLETLLGMEGYSVDQAQNAAEGLHKLGTRGYDLVLLDLMMPDRSGMEVLREIRERDQRDASRDVAPMRPADDAVLVDSSTQTIEQVVDSLAATVSLRRG